MIYIINPNTRPDYNLALEEYCFKQLTKHDKIFILWRNEPAIIVGKHQNTIEEINATYVKENNIHVIRRNSGGGAVYHDLNNLNYTIISNEEKGNDFDFETFSAPVIDALAELGVKAEFTGRNDLQIDGKKICGNAQAYIKGRIMHHGCILFDVDLSVLSKALAVPTMKIDSHSAKSVRSVVQNILPTLPNPIGIEQFSDKILAQVLLQNPNAQAYQLTSDELAEIEKLRTSKYATWEWNYGQSPKSNINRESRFSAGKIQVLANIKNGQIATIKFYGTFFGNNPHVHQLEEQLIGTKYDATSVHQALSTLDYNQYFAGFTIEQLTQSIVA